MAAKSGAAKEARWLSGLQGLISRPHSPRQRRMTIIAMWSGPRNLIYGDDAQLWLARGLQRYGRALFRAISHRQR